MIPSAAPLRQVTPEEIDAYERDGAVVLRGILAPAWVAVLEAAVERALAAPGDAAEEYAAKDGGRYLGDLFMWLRDDGFRDMALASPLPAIARQLMGSRAIRFFYDQLLVKEPMTPTATPWHQDLPYWPLTGNDILSLWIGCDSIAAEAGAMRYLKGSHRAGVTYAPKAFDPASGFDDIYRQAGLPPLPPAEELLERFEVLTCAVEPGDVIAHHPLTIHGSPGNSLRAARRRALALRYVGDDARFSRRPGAFLDDPRMRSLLPEPIDLEDGEPLRGANFPAIAIGDSALS